MMTMKCLALCLMLFAFSALADTAVITTPDASAPQQVFSWVIATLITLGGAGLLALLVYGVGLLRTKAKNSLFEHAVGVIDEAVTGVAARIRLELLPALVVATSPESPGGRAITSEERDQLLTKGVAILKADVAPAVLKALGTVFGGSVDSWLKGRVESAVVSADRAVAPLALRNPSSP